MTSLDRLDAARLDDVEARLVARVAQEHVGMPALRNSKAWRTKAGEFLQTSPTGAAVGGDDGEGTTGCPIFVTRRSGGECYQQRCGTRKRAGDHRGFLRQWSGRVCPLVDRTGSSIESID